MPRIEPRVPAAQPAFLIYVIAGALGGIIVGYIARGIHDGPRAAPPATVAVPPAAGPSMAIPDKAQVESFKAILARDPKAAGAAVALGNLYYDAKDYASAVPYYQQALAITPSDVNVSTDLGTALYYSGRADEALAQYKRSLEIVPDHAQTLFNIGIVNAEGKRDYLAALQAWERLKKTTPAYPHMAEVDSHIDDARRQAQAVVVPAASRPTR